MDTRDWRATTRLATKALLFGGFLLVVGMSLAYAQDKAFTMGSPTVSLAVTGTTSRVQVRPAISSPHIRVFNSGTVAVFLACGDATVVAAVASAMPIAPGTVEVLSCNLTHVAGISAGTAATVYLTPGSGI